MLNVIFSTVLFLAQAIFPSDSMQTVQETICKSEKATLAVFDVNDVLIQPDDPYFQTATIHAHREIALNLKQALSDEDWAKLLTLTYIEGGSAVLDKDLYLLMQELERKKIPTIGLTAGFTGSFAGIESMEAWRLATLNEIAISFTHLSPSHADLTFEEAAPFRGYYPRFTEGMLFCNCSKTTKGELLIRFLERAGYHPERVAFVDDKRQNLEDAQEALRKYDPQIEFVGIHFISAAEVHVDPISDEAFAQRWYQLAEKAVHLD